VGIYGLLTHNIGKVVPIVTPMHADISLDHFKTIGPAALVSDPDTPHVTQRYTCPTIGTYNPFQCLELLDDSEVAPTLMNTQGMHGQAVPPIPEQCEQESRVPTQQNQRNRQHRKGLRLGSWNVRGLTCHQKVFRKLHEVVDIITSKRIDVLAVQESWESSKCMIPTIGQYTWLGKPRLGNENGDKHGGVGFLVRNTLVDLSQVITDTSLHDSIWLKIHGTRGTQDMFIGCVYMPTNGT
jgi:hypothetical protein